MTKSKLSSIKITLIILASMLLFIVLSLAAYSSLRPFEFRLTFHESELTQLAEDYLKNKDNLEKPAGVSRVLTDTTEDHSRVIFETGGYGLGAATSYTGYYYSPDDTFISCIQSPGTVLVEEPRGNIAHWQETSGDNECYVTRLGPHWYRYLANF